MQRKDAEIERLNGAYDRLLEESGIALFRGRARITGPHTVTVNDTSLSARFILVATGSHPHVPDIPGREFSITSDDVFHLPALPRRTLIVGGGYIGVEFVGILHGMGSEVTLAYRGDLFLRGFDHDLRAALRDAMRGRDIDLRFNLNVVRLVKADHGITAEFTDGNAQEYDAVLMATGRQPLVADLGLEEAGVRLNESGAIEVDAYSKTSVDSIYAVGDVTDRINLTPVALHEGSCVAHTLFAGTPVRPDYDNVATAIFSRPPCACCGLTEERARAEHDVLVYRSSFTPLKNTLSGRDEESMFKLIVDRSSNRVLGFHMVGPDAAEILQGFAAAMQCGLTKRQLDATIGIHPTAAEEWVSLRNAVQASSD
jgi:glutathione reductase (NADPH)